MFTKSHDDGWVKMLDGVHRQTLNHGEKTLLIKARFDAGAEMVPPVSSKSSTCPVSTTT